MITIVDYGSGKKAFFVHSYYCVPEDSSAVVAWADYGQPFASIVAYKNLFGIQFHPEKSQNIGLSMLKNFGAFEYAADTSD